MSSEETRQINPSWDFEVTDLKISAVAVEVMMTVYFIQNVIYNSPPNKARGSTLKKA